VLAGCGAPKSEGQAQPSHGEVGVRSQTPVVCTTPNPNFLNGSGHLAGGARNQAGSSLASRNVMWVCVPPFGDFLGLAINGSARDDVLKGEEGGLGATLPPGWARSPPATPTSTLPGSGSLSPSGRFSVVPRLPPGWGLFRRRPVDVPGGADVVNGALPIYDKAPSLAPGLARTPREGERWPRGPRAGGGVLRPS
jgi:hypothetical protein